MRRFYYLEEILAERTKDGRSLGLACSPKRLSTTGARLGRAAVNLVSETEGARPALAVNVVADGRAALGGRQGQDMPDHVSQAAAAIGRETCRDRLWMKPGSEQNLVGIDVADPGHEVLVEKGRLDRSLRPGQGSTQCAGVDAQGVRAQV